MLLFVIFTGSFVFVFTDFLCFLYRSIPSRDSKTLSLKGKNKGKSSLKRVALCNCGIYLNWSDKKAPTHFQN